ncbi:hypothetical protein H0H92_009914 [Tricholoma furcatifolium]|nr:hypothetical protein H0H92_009914 [Tricholoma furcatifolium]
MPLGYQQLAEINNVIPIQQYPYQMVTYNGVIVPDGTIDERGVQDVNATLRRPHGNSVKKSRSFYRRKTELQKIKEIEDDDLHQ